MKSNRLPNDCDVLTGFFVEAIEMTNTVAATLRERLPPMAVAVPSETSDENYY